MKFLIAFHQMYFKIYKTLFSLHRSQSLVFAENDIKEGGTGDVTKELKLLREEVRIAIMSDLCI